MRSFARNALILMLGLALGVSLVIGHGVYADRQASSAPAQTLPLEDLRTLSEIFGRIKNDYVEDVPDSKLLENAIRGMISGLDPHSAYLGRDEFNEMRIDTSGEFGGLGIEVGMEDGFVKVIAPIDDTPAQRAGIQPGDLVIRLDDTPVKGMTLSEAVKLMRGKIGSDITLTIVREGADKPLRVTLTRARIQVRSVKSRLLEPGFGYVRISHFQQHTGEDLLKALGSLKKESGGALKGLVLDLRNNPGGLLDAAVDVSNAFLDKGSIVTVKGRVPGSNIQRNATPNDALKSASIVVLVNGGSASASEIVAGALQDHRRAVIMGSPTFGKGSVQTILPLDNETALKLTTARYYTPSGRSIQAEGIRPDIELDDLKVDGDENSDGFLPVKESNLSRHLENGEAKPAAADQDEQKSRSERLALAREDYPVYQALSLLKGLHLLTSR